MISLVGSRMLWHVPKMGCSTKVRLWRIRMPLEVAETTREDLTATNQSTGSNRQSGTFEQREAVEPGETLTAEVPSLSGG